METNKLSAEIDTSTSGVHLDSHKDMFEGFSEQPLESNDKIYQNNQEVCEIKDIVNTQCDLSETKLSKNTNASHNSKMKRKNLCLDKQCTSKKPTKRQKITDEEWRTNITSIINEMAKVLPLTQNVIDESLKILTKVNSEVFGTYINSPYSTAAAIIYAACKIKFYKIISQNSWEKLNNNLRVSQNNISRKYYFLQIFLNNSYFDKQYKPKKLIKYEVITDEEWRTKITLIINDMAEVLPLTQNIIDESFKILQKVNAEVFGSLISSFNDIAATIIYAACKIKLYKIITQRSWEKLNNDLRVCHNTLSLKYHELKIFLIILEILD